MKWALIVVGIIAVLVLCVVGIGYALPVAHVAQRSVVLPVAPATVWATITDVAAYPTWRPDVDSVEVLAPVEGRQSWRERGSNGEISYAMTAVEPPSRMVTRIMDRNLPFGGEWEYVIASEGSGSRLTITERGEVYNPLFRFVSRFVMGHTATIDGYLGALSSKLGSPTQTRTNPQSASTVVTPPAG